MRSLSFLLIDYVPTYAHCFLFVQNFDLILIHFHLRHMFKECLRIILDSIAGYLEFILVSQVLPLQIASFILSLALQTVLFPKFYSYLDLVAECSLAYLFDLLLDRLHKMLQVVITLSPHLFHYF